MKIYSPNKKYNGVSAGVSFINGVGETDDKHLIEWFKERGYQVDRFEEIPPQDEADDEKPIIKRGAKPVK